MTRKDSLLHLGLVSALWLAVCVEGIAGGLKWDSNTISIKAATGDTKTEVQFGFTNTSNTPVEIGRIQTSCGCTTADLSKKVYDPGESGTIKTIFVFGGRKGPQEKSIIVPYADGSQDVLTLKVDIPDSVKVNKEMLTWEVGDPLEAQSFEIAVVHPGASVKAAKAIGSNFTASVTESDPGKIYRVEVTPTKTDRPMSGTIRVEVADPGSRAIYLKVRVE